jgi:hypothetical protein
VNNALNNRDSIDMNIFGMQGVPPSIVQERNLMGAREYWTKVYQEKVQKLEQERRKLQKPGKKEKKEEVRKVEEVRQEGKEEKEIGWSQPVSFNIGGFAKK